MGCTLPYVHGNVNSLLQDNPELVNYKDADGNTQRYKRIDYEYDLVSGNVNKVIYQAEKADMLIHKYEYDADNKITNVYTSKDDVIYDEDVTYFYYQHGPLARVELGENNVQGIDYAYTLQGWIKGVNSDALEANYDIGKDGALNIANTARSFSRDAYSYSLGYYQGDYTGIGGSSVNFLANKNAATYLATDAPNLYNGNISSMATSIYNIDPYSPKFGDVLPQLTAYRYDQLNRITQMKAYQNLVNNAWGSGSTYNSDYEMSLSYDANGNIKTLNRNGYTDNTQGIVNSMDNLSYTYYKKDGSTYIPSGTPVAGATNKLAYIDDAATSAYTVDIDDQAAGNYDYDKIGNLKKDASEGIENIEWTIYGKVKSITKSDGTSISYKYDATGNRISKTLGGIMGGGYTIYYVRDAQGNIMATYRKGTGSINNPPLTLVDFQLYGSSRYGVLNYTNC
ncbi:MAG TPA: hypothetical protein PLC59_11105 [Bacteroidales bacterium]|nr:hypothetical protein [Bacteroidales bacterium]